jgi:deoxyadenosine/deoxycytidine kinase
MTISKPEQAKPPGKTVPLIGVVGPCAAGKSTLVKGLSGRGYRTRHIAQEHSYVKDMWKRLTNPDILVFLDASYPVTCQRRKLDWTEAEYAEQHRRLAHAREHADLYLKTDDLAVEEILSRVIAFIEARGEEAFPRRL